MKNITNGILTERKKLVAYREIEKKTKRSKRNNDYTDDDGVCCHATYCTSAHKLLTFFVKRCYFYNINSNLLIIFLDSFILSAEINLICHQTYRTLPKKMQHFSILHNADG